MAILQLAFAAAVTASLSNDTCSEISLASNKTGMCGGSSVLVDIQTMTECADHLCDMYDFEYAIGSDNKTVLQGKDLGCNFTDYDSQNVTELCVDTTPEPTTAPTAAPTTAPTAAPSAAPTTVPVTPVPGDICEPIELGTNNGTCEDGTVIIGYEALNECAEVLCKTLNFTYATSANDTTVLTGRSLGCKLISRNDTENVTEMCVSVPVPPTNAPATMTPKGKKGSSGMSGAAIFFVILFSLIGGYLFFGILFNHFVCLLFFNLPFLD